MEWKTVLAKSDIILPFGHKGRRSFPKKRLLSETNWNRYLKNLHLVEKLWIELLIQWVFSKNTVYLPMKFCDARIKLQVLILDLCIYLMSFLVDLSMWWNGRNMLHTRVWYLRKMSSLTRYPYHYRQVISWFQIYDSLGEALDNFFQSPFHGIHIK